MAHTPKAATHGSVSFLIEGDDRQVRRILTRMEMSLDPAAMGLWMGTTVDPWIRQRARDRFRNEGDDVTGTWAPLKQSTWKFRSDQGYGSAHPINHRTGKLEQYITGSPERITIHSLGATLTMPGRAPFGELKKKVETAQYGREEPRTVKRPVMGVNERDLLFVLTEMSFYLTAGPF